MIGFLLELFFTFIHIHYELTDYSLRTAVSADGQVEVFAIDRNENEVFRFYIDKDLML